jgi:hypothetical protein
MGTFVVYQPARFESILAMIWPLAADFRLRLPGVLCHENRISCGSIRLARPHCCGRHKTFPVGSITHNLRDGRVIPYNVVVR